MGARLSSKIFLAKNTSGMQPTQEQLDIGTSIANGVSVIVNAVAGSGKTTTILSVAARLPEARARYP